MMKRNVVLLLFALIMVLSACSRNVCPSVSNETKKTNKKSKQQSGLFDKRMTK